MRKLWITIVAALGLSFWPAAYAHADWEDAMDDLEDAEEERQEALNELAKQGYFVPTRRVTYVERPVTYIERGNRVIIERERPVVRRYERTIFIDD